MGDRRMGLKEAFELAQSRGFKGVKQSLNNFALKGRLQEFGVDIVPEEDRESGRFAQNYIDLREQG
jgi:hypothetical protein